jgi:hypothetical protein
LMLCFNDTYLYYNLIDYNYNIATYGFINNNKLIIKSSINILTLS